MLDLIIKNGVVIDGSGKDRRRAEIGIKDGKIAVVAPNIAEDAAAVIDAEGSFVAPGFVDIHRHADIRVFSEDFGEAELRQGITTIVCGQCGLSVVPCPPERKKEIFDFLLPIVGRFDGPIPFSTFKEYAEQVEKQGLPLNFGYCVGNGTTRMAVNGFKDGKLSPEHVSRARRYIEESLRDGALGVTLGVVYSPENNYNVDGFVEVLQPMKEFDVPLVTHIRGEADILHESLREVIEIARRLGVRLHVSHFKCEGKSNWGHGLSKALEILEDARESGVKVTVDVYPYSAGASQMAQYLPPDYLDGGIDETVRKLLDPASRKRLVEILEAPQDYFENLLLATGWENTLITSVTKEENRQYVGLRVTELAEKLGKDPYEAAFDLMADERCAVGMINFAVDENDNRRIICDPHSNIISDALYSEGGLPHPRAYGAFPLVLAKFVREENLLSLESAVHKMTRKPAEVYHLASKGLIEAGMDADIVVFDLEKVGTEAGYTDPRRLAVGFDYVIVGGQIAVQNDVWRKTDSGRFLYRS